MFKSTIRQQVFYHKVLVVVIKMSKYLIMQANRNETEKDFIFILISTILLLRSRSDWIFYQQFSTDLLIRQIFLIWILI